MIDRSYKDVPVGPQGDLMSYSEQILVSSRSAPTNTGWRSVLVMVILAFTCSTATMVYGLISRQVPVVDTSLVADNYVTAGNGFYQQGDYDRAISEYTEAINTEPSDAQAFLLRAHAYLLKGDQTSAGADYRRVLSLGADDNEIRTAQKALAEMQAPQK